MSGTVWNLHFGWLNNHKFGICWMAKSQQCWFLVHCFCFVQAPCGWLNPRYSWLKLPIGFSSRVFFVKLPRIFVKCRIIRDCLDGAKKTFRKNIWWKTSKMVSYFHGWIKKTLQKWMFVDTRWQVHWFDDPSENYLIVLIINPESKKTT